MSNLIIDLIIMMPDRDLCYKGADDDQSGHPDI